ncbi:MAG: thioredoxin family protein [Cyclobacteriaceae bacterium]|nr:thioredoxin family protein [Cyclobacteriaceae bacterium SS2]
MNYTEYKQLFEEILANPSYYNKESYMEYTRLNRSRMKRWDKLLVLEDSLSSRLKEVTSPQKWIIITEPWCGDAAHVIPFLVKMTELNELISYDIQLRDSEPFLIDSYLTNGSKSIPKLIIKDEIDNDLFVWGPRPNGAAEVLANLKAENADSETIKIAIQNWYNADKGKELMTELLQLCNRLQKVEKTGIDNQLSDINKG